MADTTQSGLRAPSSAKAEAKCECVKIDISGFMPHNWKDAEQTMGTPHGTTDISKIAYNRAPYGSSRATVRVVDVESRFTEKGDRYLNLTIANEEATKNKTLEGNPVQNVSRKRLQVYFNMHGSPTTIDLGIENIEKLIKLALDKQGECIMNLNVSAYYRADGTIGHCHRVTGQNSWSVHLPDAAFSEFLKYNEQLVKKIGLVLRRSRVSEMLRS